MAKQVFTNAVVTVNGIDFSDHVAAVTVDMSADEIDTTAFGTANFRTRVTGLKDGSVQLDWHQDYSSSVDATLYSAFGSVGTVVVLPNGTAPSSSNPKLTIPVVISGYSPVSGNVGDLLTFSTTWAFAGPIARATA